MLPLDYRGPTTKLMYKIIMFMYYWFIYKYIQNELIDHNHEKVCEYLIFFLLRGILVSRRYGLSIPPSHSDVSVGCWEESCDD